MARQCSGNYSRSESGGYSRAGLLGNSERVEYIFKGLQAFNTIRFSNPPKLRAHLQFPQNVHPRLKTVPTVQQRHTIECGLRRIKWIFRMQHFSGRRLLEITSAVTKELERHIDQSFKPPTSKICTWGKDGG